MDRNDIKNININEEIYYAKQDESLFSTLDIEQMLNSTTVGETTLNDILESNRTVLKQIYDDEYESKFDKLAGYMYVDTLRELKLGRFIRWINSSKKLTAGGFAVSIDFINEKSYILCRGINRRPFKITFDNNTIFQLMSEEEQMLLSALDMTDDN
jgi:hypothetical protein